jgi:hypothetical protein
MSPPPPAVGGDYSMTEGIFSFLKLLFSLLLEGGQDGIVDHSAHTQCFSFHH